MSSSRECLADRFRAVALAHAQLHRFCGKITSIDHDASEQTATVHFEKPSAAKTALMLNGGSLDGSTLTVTSEKEHHDERPTSAGDGVHFEQSDKPRAASE